MKLLILFALVILTGVVLTPVFGQIAESIVITTDNPPGKMFDMSSYDYGDTIFVTVEVRDLVGESVSLRVYAPNGDLIVETMQLEVTPDKTAHTEITPNQLWNIGIYGIEVDYGNESRFLMFTFRDSDNDGISNDYDKCPTVPETVNDYDDSDGCPDVNPSPPTNLDKGIFGFLGGGSQGDLPSEPLRQNPTEEAESIIENYYFEAGSYLLLSPDDTQRIADLMNEYITKIRENISDDAIRDSLYLSSSNEEVFDNALAKAGLKGEFYSSYVSLWKDIAKNKLGLVDSLETKRKNQIHNLEIDDSLKESYISKITQITNIRKNEYADGMAKILAPLEEKSNSNSAQNKIKDEILGSSKVQSGGCLIATATYGSELAPQVQQLRELRDNSLLQTASGTSFMNSFNNFYYIFSPTIADWERENPAFKEVVKITLTPMISSLSILNYVNMDSEVEVLGYGISLILLNVGMYFVAPGIVIHSIRKKFLNP